MKHLFNKKTIIFYLLMCLQLFSIAQTGDPEPPVEMADVLYQSGKIYVVIVVIAVIFAGILTYLILLDRKIGKLEKEIS